MTNSAHCHDTSGILESTARLRPPTCPALLTSISRSTNGPLIHALAANHFHQSLNRAHPEDSTAPGWVPQLWLRRFAAENALHDPFADLYLRTLRLNQDPEGLSDWFQKYWYHGVWEYDAKAAGLNLRETGDTSRIPSKQSYRFIVYSPVSTLSLSVKHPLIVQVSRMREEADHPKLRTEYYLLLENGEKFGEVQQLIKGIHPSVDNSAVIVTGAVKAGLIKTALSLNLRSKSPRMSEAGTIAFSDDTVRHWIRPDLWLLSHERRSAKGRVHAFDDGASLQPIVDYVASAWTKHIRDIVHRFGP